MLFVRNFKIIDASKMLTANANLQYLCQLLRGEALRQFYTFCSQVGSTVRTHLNRVILGLGTYFPLLMRGLSKNDRYAEEWGICKN